MASKRAIRRRACEGKRRYATQKAAGDALSKHRKGIGWMIAYHCKFCHQFHLGHPPRKVREAIAARQDAALIHG